MNKKLAKAVMEGNIKERIKNMKCHRAEIDAKIAEYEKALEENRKVKLAIPFIPQKGDTFYAIDDEGCTERYTCINDKISLGARGLCFRSCYAALLSVEKATAEAELLMMCDGLDITNGSVYVPNFNRSFDTWNVDFSIVDTSCPYRFATRETCKEAIDRLGDRKLRLIFNIPVED